MGNLHVLTLFIFGLGPLFLEVSAQPFHTLVTSLHKDPDTSLHTITLTLNPSEQYVVDLDAPFIWNRCDSPQPMVSCADPACLTARSYISPLCPEKNSTNDQCPCYDTPVNPVTGSCASSYMSLNVLTVYWTTGRSLSTYRIQYFNRYVSCAPSSLLQSLPAQAIGVASLSWSTLSLLYQFTPVDNVTRKFSLCLSSSSDNRGVFFIGDGPYYLEPPANFDASSVLSYTPLIKHPTKLGYFINVTGISINRKAIKAPPNKFALEKKGGVKLSTTVLYTTLRSDIYRVLISVFKKTLKGIRRAKEVSPFKFCFKTNVPRQKNNKRIPLVRLALADGRYWTIHESNLLKQVDDNVTCLAFVDGGDTAEHAMVIGTYQLENIMLQFDLVQSRLGFSSSFLSFGSSCGNFDFTVRA